MTTRRGFFKAMAGAGALVGLGVSSQARAPELVPSLATMSFAPPDAQPLAEKLVEAAPPDAWDAWAAYQNQVMDMKSTIAGQQARIRVLEGGERMHASQWGQDDQYEVAMPSVSTRIS